ncbi:precorrin-6y C5,15-methyltransferase (decarboxylating) subunit CbiE [Thermoanaerobacterium sp. DL9XJH110]|uniref:precorrin-6y C5,15-methyltransferase (decarboxylating) subunit CbiE n=1 Tax=Thermoanaerobacterium sp. DL9XJH110 TaxID=3386643 RepID=UPI003BB5CD44
MTVVGMGPGAPEYITPAALQRIGKADVLVGGKRHLELFTGLDCEKKVLGAGTDFKEILNRKGNVVVLASGEPGLYGILDLVLRCVEREKVEVIPGISSVQYFLAKLKIPMKDLAVVSLHGRKQDLLSKMKEHATVVVLTDERHTPGYIAGILKQNGILNRTIYVGQNLSYEDETIEEYTVEELAKSQKEFAMNVVVVTCGNLPSASPIIFS